jgi:sialic acid synthase SpsE
MSVEIIAEISNAHNGDLNRAHRLIDAAKACGADTIKFQCYTPDELVELRGDGPAPDPWGSQGWTMRRLYEKAQTPHAWFPELVQHCKDVGMPWFSSVFGLDSLALLESLGCPRYKIAALDNTQELLLQWVKSANKPVVVSASDSMMALGPDTYLYCPPGYPTPDDKVNLAAVQEEFGGSTLWDGVSLHTQNQLAFVVAASFWNVTIIEAHFMLDTEPSELESNVSLNETAFKQMVANVRTTERLLG